jgi:hypothetical protein
LWESGFHPWECSADLTYYAARYDLEWKDHVYCDVSFSRLSDRLRLIRCEFVNRTDLGQSLALDYIASLHFAPSGYRVQLPDGALWVDARDYRTLQYAKPRPDDHLMPDGLLRGETRDPDFVDGAGVGRNFGAQAGDTAVYDLTLPAGLTETMLLVRYRVPEGRAAEFSLEGAGTHRISLPGGPGVRLASFELGNLAAGRHTLRLCSTGGTPVNLDGLALVSRAAAGSVRFVPASVNAHPEISTGPMPSSLLLHYPDLPQRYGLAWSAGDFQIRQLLTDELDSFFRFHTHQHTRMVLKGTGDGHYTDVFRRPIPLEPHASRILYAIVGSGTESELRRDLGAWAEPQLEDAWRTARAGQCRIPATPAGERYAFSQRLMAATTLSNVVYPIYLRRCWIKHNTPGRFWDSLYTWDSGFTGLGLLELDTSRAVDCLNTYLTQPGDEHAAYIQHGTPLPTQIYLFREIWNRTQSRALLEYFYPRVRQMHIFLAGHATGSVTRPFASGLLNTWDYFYNTGWDDYPAQMHVHANGLAKAAAPVVTTAHAIRTAKILRLAALELGLPGDAAGYDEDIRVWSEALQRYSWDEDAGYFGYVLHDAKGKPNGILRHASGANFNMALGGASPLIAGICTEAQERRLAGHLFSGERLWTPIGLSTIDQSAPYYRRDGYWNGAVWMPHQWFFWKALLDRGRAGEAHRIARTALELWKTETEATYNCFEHFRVDTGRGAGWHQFSGLSCPVLCWFSAYHRPGTLTTGFDAWIRTSAFADGNRVLQARIAFHGADPRRRHVLLAAMQPGPRYRVRLDGREVPHNAVYPGVLEIAVEAGAGDQLLAIEPE